MIDENRLWPVTSRRQPIIFLSVVIAAAVALSLACLAPQPAEAKTVKGTGSYWIAPERFCVNLANDCKSGSFKLVGAPERTKGSKTKYLKYDIYYFKVNNKTKYYIENDKGRKKVTVKKFLKKLKRIKSVSFYAFEMKVKNGVARKVCLN